MQTVQLVPRDGLGFPILPIVMGAVSAVGAIAGKKGSKLTEADAKKAVQQIFLEILEREPDYPANQPRVDCLLRREDKSLGQDRFGPGTCNVDDLRTELLQSKEYRDLQVRKAQTAYGLAPGATGLAPSPGASADAGVYPPGAGGVPGEIFGIPLVYLIGGVGLLMLMRR